LRISVLGCGTSFGVPRIGNDWGECDPGEPRNRRTRSSILIESAGKRLLVDCGPDLREQLLAADVATLDGVIVTHDHADHCHGIDELRAIEQVLRRPVPLYARADVLESLQKRFGYIFSSRSFYRAVAEPIELPQSLDLGNATLRFVDQPHGGITSVGMRIEENGRSAVYSIDFNELTDEMRALYKGADVWISDCLSRRPHPTHTHLGAVLGWARDLEVAKVFLSHLNNSMDYATLVAELPDWAVPGHDGLEIELG
jgi:phosphoribosyl 1,2-cyclic phosphate phosphodiesterase